MKRNFRASTHFFPVGGFQLPTYDFETSVPTSINHHPSPLCLTDM